MSRIRRFIVGALALLALPVGCGSSAAPGVTVTVVPSTGSSAPTTPVTTASVSSTAPSSVSSTTTVSSSSSSSSSRSTTRTTSTSSAFNPATLPDLPPPDRDTPGPVGGAKCRTNADYADETTDGLDGNLIAAWTAVKAAARSAGVVLCLNDGKRSTAQQEQTYQDYVDQYGTGAAQTYVLPPEKSEHVAGYAIDVQPAAGYQWLERTKGAYGLCRIYVVEPWHFEFSKSYVNGCPTLLAGPVTSH